jgi:hypothetical protein
VTEGGEAAAGGGVVAALPPEPHPAKKNEIVKLAHAKAVENDVVEGDANLFLKFQPRSPCARASGNW